VDTGGSTLLKPPDFVEVPRIETISPGEETADEPVLPAMYVTPIVIFIMC
jgi:hypothetical protein